LIYSAIMSVDGYIEDPGGGFDWAVPDPEVHGFINDLERSMGTYLYGRRMYEMMIGWETDPSLAEQSTQMRAFAQMWQAADKIVYSRTLENVSTARTRIEREFDPNAVRQLKARVDHDLAIGGPDLATHAFRAGLVDECHLFLVPIIVGGGKPALPAGVLLPLELVDERRFASGFVFLRYRSRPTSS
jgi:dihydrofolate reductase